MRSLKNNLVLLRKQNKIKQRQLAEEIGISRQSIYSIEKGKFLPTVDTAIKIAKFFGKPVEEIFFLDEHWLVSECAEPDAELVTGQGNEKYSALRYGRFSFSFNGGEIAAVYNAMLLLGKSVGLENTVREFENNKMAVMFGLAGTDPKRLGEYFEGHDVKYKQFSDRISFSGELEEGSVFVVSYCESVKRPVHTVAGKIENGKMKLFNIHDGDTEPRYEPADSFFDGRPFIYGYILQN